MAEKRVTEQQRRFEEAAREAGCDETGEVFERTFAKIVPPKLRPAKTAPNRKARTKE